MRPEPGWEALLEPGKATDFFTADVPPFPPDKGWSPAAAWWLAELSRAIYVDRDRADYFARAGLKEELFFFEGSAQGAVVSAMDGSFSALVFRGTDQPRDWITNLRAAHGRWPAGGKVHRGFRSAFRAVWDEIEVALDAIENPIFYTGHSLGGALAVLASSLRPPVATYTFGAPRVGDAEFTTTLRSPLHRVVNGRDIVPSLPPPIGFEHGGTLFRLGADPDGDADDVHLEDLADRRRWYHPHPKLSDHAPVNYLAALTALL